jgi:hypothetical protein
MIDHLHSPAPEESRRRGHELDRINARAVITVGLILGGVVLGSLAFLASLHAWLVRRDEVRRAPLPVRRAMDRPAVDFDQPAQLRALREWERTTLEGYGWQDEEKTSARVPVERAMDMLLEQGFPVEDAAESSSPTEAPPPTETPPAAADQPADPVPESKPESPSPPAENQPGNNPDDANQP